MTKEQVLKRMGEIPKRITLKLEEINYFWEEKEGSGIILVESSLKEGLYWKSTRGFWEQYIWGKLVDSEGALTQKYIGFGRLTPDKNEELWEPAAKVASELGLYGEVKDEDWKDIILKNWSLGAIVIYKEANNDQRPN